MANHEIREGNLVVSLTSDAFEYNNEQFTLEVTAMDGNSGVENDADISGLRVTASQPEIDGYLAAAMAHAKVRCGDELHVRNSAGYVAQAGIAAIQDKKPIKGASARM